MTGRTDPTDLIERGLRAWMRGDLEALAAVLDPAVTLRAATPGPWDCTSREQVMRLLCDREATRDPEQRPTVTVRQIDDHTFEVSSAADPDTATSVSIADGKVVAMQQFSTSSQP